MDARDDISILKLLRDDPDQGMSMLIKGYYGKVLNLCYSYVRDKDESRDLTQEIFMKLLTSLESFEGRSRLSTWIYRVSVNACIDTVRKMKRNPVLPMELSHLFPEDREDAETREVSETVRDTIAQLPLHFRTIIILREMEGKSYREMADILGCSVGTVESRLYRGREMLRRLLAPRLRGDLPHEV